MNFRSLATLCALISLWDVDSHSATLVNYEIDELLVEKIFVKRHDDLVKPNVLEKNFFGVFGLLAEFAPFLASSVLHFNLTKFAREI